MTSYQVWVWTGTDAKESSNGIRFASREDAESWALNLAMRWTMVRDWTVRESDDEPNI